MEKKDIKNTFIIKNQTKRLNNTINHLNLKSLTRVD